MRHIAISTTTTLALALGFAVSARPAAAAAPVNEDYSSAMRTFVVTLEGWGDAVQTAADAIAIKPELACGTDLQALAAAGQFMADDLVGTARLAPANIAFIHGMLTDSVQTLEADAASACGDSESAIAAIRAERAGFDWALAAIKFHAKHSGEGN